MGGFFGGGTIVGATSFNFVAITHGSAKFAVLRKRLEAMNSNDPNADRAMANCIKDHQNAIMWVFILPVLNIKGWFDIKMWEETIFEIIF